MKATVLSAVIAVPRTVRRLVGLSNTARAVVSEANTMMFEYSTPLLREVVVVDEDSQEHEFVKKAQDARRERLLKEEGIVYEVLYVSGVTAHFGSKIHSDGLLKGEADKIFDAASPHARVCVVTQRDKRGADVSSWHRVWLPTSRWHQKFLTKWCQLLRPEMEDMSEAALVLGVKGQSKDDGQFSATGWELRSGAAPAATGLTGKVQKVHCLSKICACLK